jgi:hypothetical protein
MRWIARWLLESPWWLWIGGWIAALFLHGAALDHAGNALALITWIPLVLCSVAVLLLPVRFIVKSGRRGGWRTVMATILVLLVAGFVVQRLVSPGGTLEIEDAARAAMTSTDPSYCSEDVTELFVEQQNDAQTPFADDLCEEYADYDRAESVRVSDVDINGNTATAIVAIKGGSYDGFSLELELTKQNGDWRANRFLGFVRFDRPAFERSYRHKFAQFGSPERAAECAIRISRRLSTPQLEGILLSSHTGPWGRIAAKCDRPGTERSLIAAFNEHDYVSPRVAHCLESRIESLSTAEIARASDDEIAFGTLLLDCDRTDGFSYLRRSLEEGSDIDPGAAGCVVDELSGRRPPDAVRLIYDEPSYDRVIEGCKR